MPIENDKTEELALENEREFRYVGTTKIPVLKPNEVRGRKCNDINAFEARRILHETAPKSARVIEKAVLGKKVSWPTLDAAKYNLDMVLGKAKVSVTVDGEIKTYDALLRAAIEAETIESTAKEVPQIDISSIVRLGENDAIIKEEGPRTQEEIPT